MRIARKIKAAMPAVGLRRSVLSKNARQRIKRPCEFFLGRGGMERGFMFIHLIIEE